MREVDVVMVCLAVEEIAKLGDMVAVWVPVRDGQ